MLFCSYFVVTAVVCLQYFRLLFKQSQFQKNNWLAVDIHAELNEDLLKYATERGAERGKERQIEVEVERGTRREKKRRKEEGRLEKKKKRNQVR